MRWLCCLSSLLTDDWNIFVVQPRSLSATWRRSGGSKRWAGWQLYYIVTNGPVPSLVLILIRPRRWCVLLSRSQLQQAALFSLASHDIRNFSSGPISSCTRSRGLLAGSVFRWEGGRSMVLSSAQHPEPTVSEKVVRWLAQRAARRGACSPSLNVFQSASSGNRAYRFNFSASWRKTPGCSLSERAYWAFEGVLPVWQGLSTGSGGRWWPRHRYDTHPRVMPPPLESCSSKAGQQLVGIRQKTILRESPCSSANRNVSRFPVPS